MVSVKFIHAFLCEDGLHSLLLHFGIVGKWTFRAEGVDSLHYLNPFYNSECHLLFSSVASQPSERSIPLH